MAYETIQEFNATNLDSILVYMSQELPFFMPLMLVFLWVAIAMCVYLGTRKFSGQGDFYAAAASSGFFVVLLAAILSLYSGIINLQTIVILIGISIVSIVLLLVRRNRD